MPFKEPLTEKEIAEDVYVAPEKVETKGVTEKTGDEETAKDSNSEEDKDYEIWEGLNNKKYVAELFDAHEIADEFDTKMQLSKIDKYVKNEIETRNFAKTKKNYDSIIAEIETQIDSSRLETYSRIQRIVGYIGVLNKLNHINNLKKEYVLH